MNAPKIRFKESDDEWKEKKLNDIATFSKGKGISKESVNNSGRIPCIRYGELYTKYNEEIETVTNFTSDSNLIFSKTNDVIIPSSGETAIDLATASCICTDTVVALGGDINIIRTNENGLFLSYSLNNINRKKIAQLAQGISVMHLYNSHLSKLKINFPQKKEQNKIATFISLVAKRINLQEDKIDKLELYKKGIMQKIFTQDIRFKEDSGNKYSEWEEKRLSQLLHERNIKTTLNDKYEHVSLTKEGVVPKSSRYERDFLVRQDNKKYKITKFNDICYNPANLKFGVICRNKYNDAIFSPIYITYEVLDNYSPLYLEYYLCRKEFINKVRKYEEGTVYERMAVKSSDFLKYKNEFPSRNEQNKIAKLLSSLDLIIEKEKTKYEQLKKLKKGLLQQMFV